jgi:hypothetical protein
MSPARTLIYIYTHYKNNYNLYENHLFTQSETRESVYTHIKIRQENDTLCMFFFSFFLQNKSRMQTLPFQPILDCKTIVLLIYLSCAELSLYKQFIFIQIYPRFSSFLSLFLSLSLFRSFLVAKQRKKK